MGFSPPVLGCLVKTGFQKEGSGAPQDPPATPLGMYMCKKSLFFFFIHERSNFSEVALKFLTVKLTENGDTQRLDPKF